MTGESKKKKNTYTSKKQNKNKRSELKKAKDNRIREDILAVVILAFGAFFIVALQTKGAGQIGSEIAGFLKGMFGLAAYILPYYLILYGILVIAKKTSGSTGRNVILMLVTYLSLTLINSGRFIVVKTMITSGYISSSYSTGQILDSGGLFGMLVGLIMSKLIGVVGLYIFSTVLIIICGIIIINTPISAFIENMKLRRDIKREEKLEQEELIRKDREEYEKQVREEVKRKVLKNSASQEEKAKKFSQQMMDIEPGKISKGQKNIISLVKEETDFGINDDENDKCLKSENDKRNKAKGFSFFSKKEKPDLMQEVLEEENEQIPESVEYKNLIEDDQIDSSHSDADTIGKTVMKDDFKDETNIEGIKKISKKEAENAFLTQEDFNKESSSDNYRFPPIELLENKKTETSGNEKHELRDKAEKLEETLQNFRVDARVINVTKGPAVTQYEIQPSVGVKVSSIVRLADDIALNLEARSIRIEAPIPGKAAVGIEVENDKINLVSLREIIDSNEFKKEKSKIAFAVGKDISGKSIIADLKGMPHMLIAGSTGSGKSVCINSIIISIIYRAKPDEVKLVLIDPKVVELGNYNGIPHLLIPVVTDPAKAAAALNWAVAEMTDRYRKFADESVRDLDSYNQKKIKEGKRNEKLPQIVIIIDELADLMMAAPQQVEESICRLAQMARAAGMHLIVATQRPSVDIITGVIKANIPSRIAFAVSSQVDSRTILDMGGAEKLVGKGDMLFNPIGRPKPLRVQGSFVSDGEVHRVIEYVKNNFGENVEYADDIINKIDTQSAINSIGADSEDDLFEDAIETVVKAGQASVSMLQRRFRIGYNRAARLIEDMEAKNIIGPADGSRPRKVFMTEEQFADSDNDNQNDHELQESENVSMDTDSAEAGEFSE